MEHSAKPYQTYSKPFALKKISFLMVKNCLEMGEEGQDIDASDSMVGLLEKSCSLEIHLSLTSALATVVFVVVSRNYRFKSFYDVA